MAIDVNVTKGYKTKVGGSHPPAQEGLKSYFEGHPQTPGMEPGFPALSCLVGVDSTLEAHFQRPGWAFSRQWTWKKSGHQRNLGEDCRGKVKRAAARKRI